MATLLSTARSHVAEICIGVISATWYKAPFALIAGLAGFMVGSDNKASMAALLVLIFIDLITAIGARFKIGEAIESRKILKTATKVVVYGLMVSGAHLTENIVPAATFIDTAAISFLAITELVSIIENAGKMGYAIPQKLLNKLVELRDK